MDEYIQETFHVECKIVLVPSAPVAILVTGNEANIAMKCSHGAC